MYSIKKNGEHRFVSPNHRVKYQGRSYVLKDAPIDVKEALNVFEAAEEKVDTKVYNRGNPTFIETGWSVIKSYPNKTMRSDEDLRMDKYLQLGSIRYEKETGGIVVGTDSIPTDESSQAKITGAAEKAGKSPLHTFDFKVGPGEFKQFNKVQIDAIFDAVSNHVQACYTAEKTHAEAIALLSGQAIVDYDITTGWPV